MEEARQSKSVEHWIGNEARNTEATTPNPKSKSHDLLAHDYDGSAALVIPLEDDDL
jgi:hypothetical protein